MVQQQVAETTTREDVLSAPAIPPVDAPTPSQLVADASVSATNGESSKKRKRHEGETAEQREERKRKKKEKKEKRQSKMEVDGSETA